MELIEWTAVIAIIMSAASLGLEVRRWFETGPRLSISLLADAETFPEADGKTYFLVTMSNRGDRATTIDAFALMSWESRFHKHLRRNASWNAVIAPDPRSSPLPDRLEVGGQWKGICRHGTDLEERRKTGALYAAVYASHRRRPYLIRFPSEAPENPKKLFERRADG